MEPTQVSAAGSLSALRSSPHTRCSRSLAELDRKAGDECLALLHPPRLQGSYSMWRPMGGAEAAEFATGSPYSSGTDSLVLAVGQLVRQERRLDGCGGASSFSRSAARGVCSGLARRAAFQTG